MSKSCNRAFNGIAVFFLAAVLIGCLSKEESTAGAGEKAGGDKRDASDDENLSSASEDHNVAYAGGVQALPESRSITALVPIDDCDVSSFIDRESMLVEIRELLDLFEEDLLSNVLSKGYFCRSLAQSKQNQGYSGMSFGPMTVTASTFTGGASKFSTTNSQVPDIDEADFVKNDDNYIYLVSDGKLQIIDAWPPEQSQTVGSISIKGTPKKLYVNGDRAVVYSAFESDDAPTGPLILVYLRYLRAMQRGDPFDFRFILGRDGESIDQECTYGYSCEFRGDGNDLLIQTYDISDRTKPALIRETSFGGSSLNSRRIGDVVHTIVGFSQLGFANLEFLFSEFTKDVEALCCGDGEESICTDQDILDRFDRLRADSEQAVSFATILDFLSGVKDVKYSGDKVIDEDGLSGTCHNIYLSSSGDGTDVLALVSFDMSRSETLGLTAIVGKTGAVYASKDALYVASRHYSSRMSQWYFDESDTNREATTIHKFALAPGSVQTTYVGSGVVKGRVLNQFSMDERDGYLRIATTTGQVPDPDVHSTLSVLHQRDGELEVVGIVDEIAPDEDIRSVRFNGDLGFVVTFKKTDPLFVIDLSDPTDPEIQGELKVPGFATYIHLMDDKHLLTLGYDAEETKTGTFAWFQGLQLRVLDVSELDRPRVLSEVTIGTRGSTSDAATNHLAFNYFPQRDLLALPMTICEGGSGGNNYGDVMAFSGLLVYRVTADNGFELLGGVPHEQPDSSSLAKEACQNWWTDSNAKVKRSIFMSSDSEDFVYSIATDLINVSKLKDLENPLASVALIESE
ncbi:MAG: beta-propeller domain-containing protein [Deltaproteobacteria bacterium]|nr:beta-propeller domain-containing protein [Deltaproteobacteria bacterium]